MGPPKLTNKQKLSIVIEGIKGRPVSEICSSYGISQAQYYRIRDQFFSNAEEVFTTQTPDRKRDQLLAENQQLKECVAELTLELKKNADW